MAWVKIEVRGFIASNGGRYLTPQNRGPLHGLKTLDELAQALQNEWFNNIQRIFAMMRTSFAS